MFRVCVVARSRPQRQHFRKKIPGFYSPYYGASFMKHYPVIPYERKSSSLFHYPEVSPVTGKKINWLYDRPTSGFEGVDVYGPNTIELSGLPMGKTPEYIQERLRRYFSKFGVVTACRALNHPLDPYQCEGRAFVSFRLQEACGKAVNSVIRFPRNRVLKIRDLSSDKVVDGRKVIAGWENDRACILCAVRKLHALASFSISQVEAEISPQELQSIMAQYESLECFFSDLSSLFIFSPCGVLARRLVCLESELSLIGLRLKQKNEAKLSVPWRATAPVELPSYTQRRIKLWDRKDALPFDLEVLSRDMRQHRVHDEKFLIEQKNKRIQRNQRRTLNRLTNAK